MKNIQAVSIWDNGQSKQASVLNTYAVNVALDHSATFWYGLYVKNPDDTVGKLLAQGNINMTGETYDGWETDSFAWEWVAEQLNLTITGDYVAPTLTLE